MGWGATQMVPAGFDEAMSAGGQVGHSWSEDGVQVLCDAVTLVDVLDERVDAQRAGPEGSYSGRGE
jgi:hypothetical protein